MADEFRKPFTAPPVIFAVSLLLGLAIGYFDPHPFFPLWLQLLLGVGLTTVGLLLIRSSMARFQDAGTTYNPFAPSTALVTTGIYRYTRNPGYLGLAVIHTGLAAAFDSPWIALSAVVAVLVTGQFVIELEEEKLTKAFGQEYTEYLDRVRRWI